MKRAWIVKLGQIAAVAVLVWAAWIALSTAAGY